MVECFNWKLACHLTLFSFSFIDFHTIFSIIFPMSFINIGLIIIFLHSSSCFVSQDLNMGKMRFFTNFLRTSL
jgi:hypothetical protein